MKLASLRGHLLLWLGLPLLLLWGLSVYTHYASALQAANQAYDRSLLASARTVAERIRVHQGHLEVDVPWVVLDSFERNMSDQLYYQVISPEGKTLSGYDDLPPLPKNTPLSQHYPALVHFYYADYNGLPIRVAALWQPVNEENVQGMAQVLVAETLTSRQDFAGGLLYNAILSQGALVFITLLLASGVLHKVLRPLRRLSGVMLLRDPGDLTPLPAVLPWSEIQPLIVAVNRYIERLRAMVARQQRFSADASHQLRTPLTILKTQVSVALNSQNPAIWQESLQGMRHTLDDTIILTDRLLQLSRIKAMQQNQPVSSLNLAELVREACLLRYPQARSRQIDLGYEGDEHSLVRGDALLLTELCANLLDNAIKYTPEGGIITASVIQSVLHIEDSGPGIAESERQQVLQPFYRLEHGSQVAGTGLGLALVKDIVRWHGGQVRLSQSLTLGGLHVTIAFPPVPSVR